MYVYIYIYARRYRCADMLKPSQQFNDLKRYTLYIYIYMYTLQFNDLYTMIQ